MTKEVQSQYKYGNQLISNITKIFRKASSRPLFFKIEAPDLPLPLELMITQWSTWINAAIYYCEHFEIILDIVNKLDS